MLPLLKGTEISLLLDLTLLFFLGFSTTQKDYKILDLQTNKVFVTRNSQFHENVFPFHHISSQTSQSVIPASISNFTNFFSYPSYPTQTSSISSISDINSSTSHSPSSPIINHHTDFVSSFHTSPTYATVLRRSIRQSKPPSHLQDYVFQPIPQSHLYQLPHFCIIVTFSSLPISQQQTFALQATYTAPYNYHEAILDPGWKEAMNKEISALHKNETWEYTDLPPGIKRQLVPNGFIKQNTIKMAL